MGSSSRMAGRPCVWVIGGPGSGKGTQCSLLRSAYSYGHLSTGDLLRSEVLAGTERWVRLFEIIRAGELAPDDEVIALLSAAMEEQPEAKGFFLDGFPANVTQAKLCQDMIGKPWKVVVLDLPEVVMVRRLTDGENFNDTDETIKKRIQTYSEETQPLIDAFSDIAIKVNADRKAEEVFADLKEI